jgi:hypothetical protein
MARAAVRPQVSRTLAAPAPVGGLNARDSLAAMPPDDAVTLDNFFPRPTDVALRNGYVKWATGLPAHVESLMPYRSASAQKLFAASGTAFYDATSAGAVGAAVVTGLTNARWQSVNTGTPGGQFLLAVNGADKLRGYDGTNWWRDGDGTHDITGVDTSTCAQLGLYKNRVFLIQANSFNVWYLPISSIAGAAASLDLSPLFKLGGYLMAMATWTIDNASGVNEFAVFISSEGEVVVYNGTDPSVAGNWVLGAAFRMGRPVGRRCFVKVGSDVIVICADGFFPLSKALLTDRSQQEDAISNKIVNLVNTDVQLYGGNFGWEAVLYPIGNKLIINVPQSQNTTQYQYVMNTITSAWCRFTNWNANCFALLGDSLYFGSNLGSGANSAFVAQCDTGNSDAGAYIFGEAKTAFRYFGAPGRQKQILMVRPIFSTAGNMSMAIGMDMDFSDSYPTGTPTFSGNGGTPWDTKLWNTFMWSDAPSVKKDWVTVNGVGDSGALHLRCVNNQSSMTWQAVEYLYQLGGVL